MTSNQRLSASLTPLDAALAALLKGAPVTPVELGLVEALRCIAADMPPLDAHPPRDIAAVDGYAFLSHDLVGASSYSPLPLTAPPVWVEAGDAMPDGCDCVLDADSVDASGPMAQVRGRGRFRGRGCGARAATLPPAASSSRPGGACCRAIS